MRLAALGAKLLIETIDGQPVPEKQNNSQATLAPILKKEDGMIQWTRSASEIYNRFRGFNPWPGAYTTFRGQQLSVTAAKPLDAAVDLKAGQCAVLNKKLIVGCGGPTFLELQEVQLAGKKRMGGEAFLNGYKLAAEEILGAVV
jgi:methionyl-tRNA formyltransferase